MAFKPFDPVSKRTEAAIEDGAGHRFQVSKGAPQVILELVAPKAALQQEVEAKVNAFAVKGYRALGVARTDAQGDWQFAGLIPLYDPPREDSAETIATAESMGVSVKMVTGDHAAIAREIAQQVHLGPNIQSVSAFLDKPDREAQRLVEEADGFAEVFPEHKFHIVELLQAKGHIVGMTGDGVNDAPALKKADAGIAVAGATDAAKSAAHIVLTRPGLSVIIDAIKEARKIFQRMQSYAIYRIAETVRVLFFIALAILVFNFYPVTAIMIVLLALLNDAPIMAIAYDRVRYSLAPEKWNMRVVLGMATFLGIIGVIASFLNFLYRAAPLKAGSGHDPMLYVPEIGSGRAPDHFSGPHPGPFLVYPPQRRSFLVSPGHQGPGHRHGHFRLVYRPSRLETRLAGVGLCPGRIFNHGFYKSEPV